MPPVFEVIKHTISASSFQEPIVQSPILTIQYLATGRILVFPCLQI